MTRLRLLILSTVLIPFIAFSQPPVITDVNPVSAPINGVVTLHGSGFSATPSNNIVYFGPVRAVVYAASPDSLVVRVPSGAAYGAITVTNAGLTGYSRSKFVPLFPSCGIISPDAFQTQVDLPAEESKDACQTGDFDGDGKPDLVATNYRTGTISVFRNSGTAGGPVSFGAHVQFTTGMSPNRVAVGDLDGDGKLDIAVTNFTSRTVSVFRNLSTPGTIDPNSFAARVDFSTGNDPWDLSIADVDLDGKPDVLTTNFTGHSVSILRNTGSPGSITEASFAPRFDLATDPYPQGAAVDDLDGDGRPDLIVANSSTTVTVFRNTASAGIITTSSFAGGINFDVGGNPFHLVISDFDGDGKPDILCPINTDSVATVLRNTATPGPFGAGSFAPPVAIITGQHYNHYATAGDLNGDGRPDILVPNSEKPQLAILQNEGLPGSITVNSFAPHFALTAITSGTVVVADLTADGKPEISVAGKYNSVIAVYQNIIPPPVPLPLARFTATRTAEQVVTMEWQTIPGIACREFTVERADSTGEPFCQVPGSFIAGRGTPFSADTCQFTDQGARGAHLIYQIRLVDRDGLVYLSATRTATPLMPGVPALLSPVAGSINQPTSLVFKWNAAAGATNYRLQVATDSMFHALFLDDSTLTDTSRSVMGLANNTRYYWHVQASTFGGKSAFAPWFDFTTLPPIPAPPTLVAPVNNSVSQPLTLSLVWRRSADATTYHVQLSLDTLFVSSLMIDTTLADTSFQGASLSNNMTYYWRVRAMNVAGSSAYSSTVGFSTALVAPVITSIQSGNKTLLITWTYPQGGELAHYRVYRDTVTGLSRLVDSVNFSATSYQSLGLKNGQRYFFRVSAVNPRNVESPLSNEVSAVVFNMRPTAAPLTSIYDVNTGKVMSATEVFSASGSHDQDGTIDSVFWYVNNKLRSTSPGLSCLFGPGTSSVMLVVQDNDGSRDTSFASVTRLFCKVTLHGPIYSGASLVGEDVMYAVASGDAIYRMNASGHIVYPLQVAGEIRSSACISPDSAVYVASSDKNLYAFSRFGTQLWPSVAMGAELLATPTIDSLSDRLYIGVNNGILQAVNRSNGVIAWSYLLEAPIHHSAVLSGDRKLVLSTVKGKIYGFDLMGGSTPTLPAWTLDCGDSITTSPAIDADGFFYVGTVMGKIIKVTLTRSMPAAVVWQASLQGRITSSPVIDAAGRLYVGTGSGKFVCLDTRTGNIVWEFPTGGAIHSTAAISRRGTIYFGNDTGSLYALDSLKNVKWSFRDSASMVAPMLVQNGVVYGGDIAGNLIGIYDGDSSLVSGTLSTTALFASAGQDPMWGTFQGNNQRTGVQSLSRIAGAAQEKELPTTALLSQNYPNPFNPTTAVSYQLSAVSKTKIAVYEMLGREVSVLVDDVKAPGRYTVTWDASRCASGVYICRMTAGGFVDSKRMLLVR